MSRDTRRRLSLLYEDDQILVIDKPAGLLTIPSDPSRAPFEDTVIKRVRTYVARPRGPRPYVGMLHRLDRDTSGALAIALTREAHVQGPRDVRRPPLRAALPRHRARRAGPRAGHDPRAHQKHVCKRPARGGARR